MDHRKLLYGSDYPLLILPGQQREPDFRPFLAQIAGLGLSQEVSDDILGRNAARLLSLLPAEAAPSSSPQRRRDERVITDISGLSEPMVSRFMAVSAVAQAWPETITVFEKYRIPWRDSPVPYWEPIAQAAAAHGLGPAAQQRLLDELNAAIGDSTAS